MDNWKKNKWAFIWHNSQANLLIGVCIVFKLFCCFSSYWCCTFWIMFKSYEWLWTKFGTILILRCLWFGLNKNGFRSPWVWNESSWSAKISYELNDREFSVKTTPPLLRGPITFSPLVHFCRFFSPTDTPRGGLHLLFEHHRQWDILARIARKPYLKCSDTGQSSLVDISNNVPETNELKIFPRFSVSPTVSSTSALICGHQPMVRGFVHGFFVCVQCRYPILSSKFLDNSIWILYSGCSALKRFVVSSPSSLFLFPVALVLVHLWFTAIVCKYLLCYSCTFAFSLACSSMEN